MIKTEYLTAEEAYKNQVWQIRPPTQHYFLGMNMTAMSEGNYLEKVIYGVINDLYTPVQMLMGRSVNCEFANMRNLNGTSKTTEEATIGLVSSAFLVYDIALRSVITGLEMTRAAIPMTTEMTTVGRWMSRAEYDIMLKTGQVVEVAGGQTFVATGGGSEAFNAATKGSIYVEFQVPTNSLLQGGKSNWFKLIGPNASKSQKVFVRKTRRANIT